MECYSSLTKSDIVYFDAVKNKERVLESFNVATLMLQKICLKSLRCYTSVNLFYIFNKEINCYQQITISEIKLLVFKILTDVLKQPSVSSTYINKIIASIKINPLVSFFGDPAQDDQAIFRTAPYIVDFRFRNMPDNIEEVNTYDKEVNNYDISKEPILTILLNVSNYYFELTNKRHLLNK